MSDIGADKGFPRVPESEPHRGHIDAPTGIATTGHEWDGIGELNTPMPRWWLWIFYATHVWALGYIILYPAIPLLRDGTTGLLGWHSRLEVAQEIDTVEMTRADLYARIGELPLESIAADEELKQVAFRGGESAFKVNCVQCHGADAAGTIGIANLNDDDWIWGGTLDEIHYTINHGVRFTSDPDTRYSEMPAFGRDEILDRTQIAAVTDHVLALSGEGPDNADGAALFADNCASCHGERGEGNHDMGAPQLNDAVWLLSGDRGTVQRQIHTPRHGAMPAWGQRLDAATIKQLAVYVHGLGGGETVPVEDEAPPSQ
jgi:cytochrome c oxidase cbb3-type subunit 3